MKKETYYHEKTDKNINEIFSLFWNRPVSDRHQHRRLRNLPCAILRCISVRKRAHADSVFLGAAPSFKKLYKNAVIDAKVSRQVVQALDTAKKLQKKGRLGDTVIIALGTNGNFNSATGQKLIDYLGPDRTIYWIDAYGRDLPVQKDVNQTIRRVAAANQNVHVIAWSKEGGKHPDWFYQDGIHLNITGQKKFARFIKKNLITE